MLVIVPVMVEIGAEINVFVLGVFCVVHFLRTDIKRKSDMMIAMRSLFGLYRFNSVQYRFAVQRLCIEIQACDRKNRACRLIPSPRNLCFYLLRPAQSMD